jgi:hypothetical protein
MNTIRCTATRPGLRGGKSWPFAADGYRQILAGRRCRFGCLQS